MSELVFQAENEQDTERLGAALARHLPDGSVVGLTGTLGAGKTRLVQAIASASGIDRREVISPTFVFIHEYHGHRSIYHFDAYRIKDADEFLELGPDEYFESGGLTLIEWADRVADCLPAERLEIEITVRGEQSRQFMLCGHGDRYDATIDCLASEL